MLLHPHRRLPLDIPLHADRIQGHFVPRAGLVVPLGHVHPHAARLVRRAEGRVAEAAEGREAAFVVLAAETGVGVIAVRAGGHARGVAAAESARDQHEERSEGREAGGDDATGAFDDAPRAGG